VSKQRNRAEQGLRARQRVHQPWPSFLDYENDDDFYDWYTGEIIPSPEEIIWAEVELIEKRHGWTDIEPEQSDDMEWRLPSIDEILAGQ
jgi:hypothetical protein